MREYLHGYQQIVLDQDSVSPTALDELFFDTGETGEQALSWLVKNRSRLEIEFANTPQLEESSSYELFDQRYERLLEINHLAEEIAQSISTQRVAQHFVDEARQVTRETDSDINDIDHANLTMAKPSVQRLNPVEQKTLLQHEIWTESERLWAIEQVILASGYQPSQSDRLDKQWRILDEDLMRNTCDGMTMQGLEDWSPTIRDLKQHLSLADHTNKRISIINMMSDQIHIASDLSSMTTDKLLDLRNQTIKRIEDEMRVFNAQNGPGSPTDRLYRNICWTESILDIQYGVKNAPFLAESNLINQLDTIYTRLLAESIRTIQATPNEGQRYTLTRFICSTVRKVGRVYDNHLQKPSETPNIPMKYEFLEAYARQLWSLHDILENQHVRRSLSNSAEQLMSIAN